MVYLDTQTNRQHQNFNKGSETIRIWSSSLVARLWALLDNNMNYMKNIVCPIWFRKREQCKSESLWVRMSDFMFALSSLFSPSVGMLQLSDTWWRHPLMYHQCWGHSPPPAGCEHAGQSDQWPPCSHHLGGTKERRDECIWRSCWSAC